VVDAPTCFIGQTQSGKTFRSCQAFVAHDGPAIFWDVQFRAREFCPEVPRVRRVGDVVRALHEWRAPDPPPHLVIELDEYTGLSSLVDYLHGTHLVAHYRGDSLPKTALFLDEVSMAADRFADADNPVVKLFTRSYGHNLIGVAITQRPAQTSRNVLGNSWEWYVFSPAPADVLTLERDYRMELPDDGLWVLNPLDHRYFRFRVGAWFRGDADGHEVGVDEVSEVQGRDAEIAVRDHEKERQEDVAAQRDSEVPKVPSTISAQGEKA